MCEMTVCLSLSWFSWMNLLALTIIRSWFCKSSRGSIKPKSKFVRVRLIIKAEETLWTWSGSPLYYRSIAKDCKALLFTSNWQRAFSKLRSIIIFSSFWEIILRPYSDMFDCSEFNNAIRLPILSGFPFKFKYKSEQVSVLRYYYSEVGTSVIKLSERSNSVMLKFTARQSVKISSPEVVI